MRELRRSVGPADVVEAAVDRVTGFVMPPVMVGAFAAEVFFGAIVTVVRRV